MNRSKIWKLDLWEDHLLHMSAKTRACLKSRLLKSQPKEFLGIRGVKGCKRIHLSIDLGQNWGQSPESSLGNGHKSYWMEARLWAWAASWEEVVCSYLMVPDAGSGIWEHQVETEQLQEGGALAPDTLTCSHVCALSTCRTPLKSARSQKALSICVGGTSGNGLVWKGVQCCNFEYWGYWSYENVAFFSVAKYCICFEMCVKQHDIDVQ